MIRRLVVPEVAERGTQLRVLEWHASPGDAIDVGALVVELESAKAIVEVRAGAAAVLRRVVVGEAEWAGAGDVLALLSDGADERLEEGGDAASWAVTFEVT